MKTVKTDPIQRKSLVDAVKAGCTALATPVEWGNGRVAVHLSLSQPSGHIYRNVILMCERGNERVFSTRQQADVWLMNVLGIRLTHLFSKNTKVAQS